MFLKVLLLILPMYLVSCATFHGEREMARVRVPAPIVTPVSPTQNRIELQAKVDGEVLCNIGGTYCEIPLVIAGVSDLKEEQITVQGKAIPVWKEHPVTVMNGGLIGKFSFAKEYPVQEKDLIRTRVKVELSPKAAPFFSLELTAKVRKKEATTKVSVILSGRDEKFR